jgi:hypothetical protein
LLLKWLLLFAQSGNLGVESGENLFKMATITPVAGGLKGGQSTDANQQKAFAFGTALKLFGCGLGAGCGRLGGLAFLDLIFDGLAFPAASHRRIIGAFSPQISRISRI